MTFTDAAASEMKERILNSLYKELEKNETNFLRKQIRLLPKANIKTIDSFCFRLIKEFFYILKISPNVIVGKQEELEILKNNVLDEILAREYEEKRESFLNLVNSYSEYTNDDDLKKDIVEVHEFIQSIPFIENWKKEMLVPIDKLNDFAQNKYGKILIKEAKENIKSAISLLNTAEKILKKDNDLEKYYTLVFDDKTMLENILSIDEWDKMYFALNGVLFDRWPVDKKTNSELKDEAKNIRDKAKKIITDDVIKKYIKEQTKVIIEDVKISQKLITELFRLAEILEQEYTKEKQKKNILSFADIEKLALVLLVDEKEDGSFEKTDIAKQISNRFVEIQVDEYQDINDVQELIIKALSNNNVFRVGDVKQSIYKFRNSKPELFNAHYNSYTDIDEITDDENIEGKKILLYKNFRSRKNIIDFCNEVFEKIMNKRLGGIEYNKKEYLNYSANYDDKDITTDIVFISKSEENLDDEDIDEETKENLKEVENIQLEASYISDKIQELINNKYMVYDKKIDGLRQLQYKDIVILLRSTKNKADVLEKVLYEKGIPVYSAPSSNYLESYEIATVLALLKIVNNPLMNIDMITVLRSYFGGFTFDEITRIKIDSAKKIYEKKKKERENAKEEASKGKKPKEHIDFYTLMIEYTKNNYDELSKKIDTFLLYIRELRLKSNYLGMTELLNSILTDSGYLDYISLENNGEFKKANLLLFLKRTEEYEKTLNFTLDDYINYLEKIKTVEVDISSANIIGEKENVVRIMTIHKSKGLEFPIVFLADSGKKFNFMDINKELLLNINYGASMPYIDSVNKVKYPTAISEAMKVMIKEETIAEEMRVLYVALTRAREKIYITSVEKDPTKYLDNLKQETKIYLTEDNKIENIQLKKKPRYIDWIMMAYFIGFRDAKVQYEVIPHTVLNIEEKKIEYNNLDLDDLVLSDEIVDKIKREFKKAELKTDNSKLIISKLPASKVDINLEKQKEQEEQGKEKKETLEKQDSGDEELVKSIKTTIVSKPKFLKDEVLTPTEKGTLMHYVFQKIPFTKRYTISEISEFLEELEKEEYITKKEKDEIDKEKIENFFKQKEYEDILKGYENGSLQKEKTFFLLLKEEDIYGDDSNRISENFDDGNINQEYLIQGVIDIYFEDENGDIFLIDYKTDRVKYKENPEKYLKNKYYNQMKVYEIALKKAYKKNVKKKAIYSVDLDKFIYF